MAVTERKYLSDYIPEDLAIEATDIIEEAVRRIEAAGPGGLTWDISLKANVVGKPGETLWRFCCGRT